MENNVKAKRRVIAILSTVIALCVIIGIVLLILHIRNNTDGRSLVGTDTTENYLNQQQSSETEAETEASKPEFEISEAGVLTAYNGDNETVVIPDNVISIGADAFGSSPRADAITTVRLGKSVEDIDVQAFVSLTKLENVEVLDENTYYKFIDGILFKNDNTVFFYMPGIADDQHSIISVFFDKVSDNIDYSGNALLVSGSVVAEIEIGYLPSTVKDFVQEKYYLCCKAISGKNQKVEFDTPIYHHRTQDGNYVDGGIYIFEAENGVVVSNIASDTGYGKTWILSQSGVGEVEIKAPFYTDREIGVEIRDGLWYDYNYSVILFYRGDDNTIKYLRFPDKFMVISDRYGSMSKYCTGMNEFAKEIGSVEIVNGEVIYNCEERFTVEEDAVGQYIKDSFDPDIYGYPTLEQLLAHNAEIYEPAK
ncbi:MAG: hypothetical protein DBX36_00550 [Oscillospiraceae bacterium]|nr:MAG: hypothetical protein DBX36_00550 [Oscillospiraceae bacterium]